MKPTLSLKPAASLFAAALLAVTIGGTHAATITVGTVGELGTSFFINTATTGGSDFTTANAALRRNFGTLTVGADGSDLTVSGIAWASAAAGTVATSAAISITYLGIDGVGGGGDDISIGNSTATLSFSGAGVYVWEFDTAMTANIPASNISGTSQFFRVDIAGLDALGAPANIRYKTEGTASANTVKLSIAGSSVAAIPEPSSFILACAGSLALLRRRR